MKHKLVFSLTFVLFCLLFYYSCEKDKNENSSQPYDPGKPIELYSYTPQTGGMATRMILSGGNFGNDPSSIKVYFNHKQAPVVGCDNGKILVITPRQPGDECAISVVIGKDSVSFPEKFTYVTTTVVTTVVGQKGTTTFKAGSFGESTFNHPAYLTVDDEYNLFLAHHDPHCVALINQQNSTVTQLFATPDKPNAPTTDAVGKVIVVPSDGGNTYKDTYYEFDPDAQWAPRTRIIIHPTAEDIANGVQDFNVNLFKHSFAVCKYDSMVYLRSNRDGYLIKFNPKTRLGQSVVINGKKMVCNPNNSDSYLVFDPINTTRLYVASTGQHCIHYFDILTGETGVYAGKSGQAGWRDGKKEDAQFNSPRQIVLDINNNLIIADQKNHCIRRITPDGNVETVVGIAGKAGYMDGNPEDALFNEPWGLAIDKDYTIYVSDYGNQCIRKLTIQ
ncbi:cell surface protein [Bacteroidia bacterium]|nr:cell surface protein [Bacteroidia bacterium]